MERLSTNPPRPGGVSMWRKLAILLEMIKFQHTVFAMPFALMGAFLAARGLPGVRVFFWVILAMVGARTCAMTFNRIVDRRFDAANPRTAGRALPAGAVSLTESWLMVVASGALFFFACFMLNATALLIAPFALGLTLVYSLTKRFTWLCHVVLGLALACSPLGGWVAVAKASADKGSKGGRKAAFRTLSRGTATSELIAVSDGFEQVETAADHPDARPLQVTFVDEGETDASFEGPGGVALARAHHAVVREELPITGLALSRSDPALPTVYEEA